MDEKLEKGINWILWIITIALLTQITLSYNLWLPTDRTYPLIGLYSGLVFGAELTSFFTLVFAGGLLVLTSVPRVRFLGFFFLFPFIILLIIEDTTRLQIWMYIYLILLGIIAWAYWQKDSQKTLQTMQFVIAMVYFWTGVQKLNPFFIEDIYPWLVQIFEWTAPLADYPILGYGIGIFELWIGLGLLFPKTRKLAIVSVLILHSLILILLVSDNYWNTIVYPWNVAMVALVFVLFRKEENPVWNATKKPHFFIIFLVGFFPILDFFGLGIHQLSFGMYSAVEIDGYVYVDDGDAVRNCIPERHWGHILEQSVTETALSIDTWANREMNVPSIGGYRVLYLVAEDVCACAYEQQKKGGLELHIPNRWTGKKIKKTISCKELLTTENKK